MKKQQIRDAQLKEYMNQQREIIYAERRKVLDGDNMRDLILKMITDIVENSVDLSISDEQASSEWDLNELNSLLLPIIPLETITAENHPVTKKNELKHMLKEEAIKLYEAKEAEFQDAEQIRELERVFLLKVIDRKWMNHIDDMEQLKQGIGLQSLGQRDPVVEYKFAGYDMFNEMTRAIQEDTVKLLLRVKVEQKVEREEVNKVTGTNKDDTVSRGPVKKAKKIGRNDLCPCGSGKKYKNCCGRNE